MVYSRQSYNGPVRKAIPNEAVSQSLYDVDFFEWTRAVAANLRRGELPPADAEYIAEEIEDLGKRDQGELTSRMVVLVSHLMKWAAQPHLRETSTWKATIDEQRDQIEDILEHSPSLRAYLIEELPKIFGRSERRASDETHLDLSADEPVRLNDETLRVLLDESFFPLDIKQIYG